MKKSDSGQTTPANKFEKLFHNYTWRKFFATVASMAYTLLMLWLIMLVLCPLIAVFIKTWLMEFRCIWNLLP